MNSTDIFHRAQSLGYELQLISNTRGEWAIAPGGKNNETLYEFAENINPISWRDTPIEAINAFALANSSSETNPSMKHEEVTK